MRTGTGRNNIEWGGGSTTSGQYLRRISTGRNDINYINISSNGTYNILERIDTSINSIRWNNLTFSLFTEHINTYTSSTTVSIPTGCGHIDIFCVGGGGAGQNGNTSKGDYAGGGGGGGYTKTVNNIVVSAGQSLSIVIGADGKFYVGTAGSANTGGGSGGCGSKWASSGPRGGSGIVLIQFNP